MKKEERQHLILKFLVENSKVTIEELAIHFNVSEMTIRRDIQYLEEKNLVKKNKNVVHGFNIRYYQDHILSRKNAQIFEKHEIAARAAQLVKPGDVIAIDGGSTTETFAEYLTDFKDITVITNDFKVMSFLRTNHHIDKYFAGGHLENNYHYSTLGHLTQNFIQHFNIDKAFIGIVSIDLQSGISHPNFEMAMAKKTFIDSAQETIVLADHTKFNNKSVFRVSPIRDIDTIITDSLFDRDHYEIPEGLNIINA